MQFVLFALVVGLESQVAENPIRRIVNLLQSMQKEVAADGEKDEEMTEKFLCYCQTSDKGLADGVSALQDKIPQIESEIAEASAFALRVDDELKQHKQDRADAKASVEAATAQRNKEAAEFDKLSSDLKANIAACGKAITAISKGMTGSFLQSGAANTLKTLVLNSKLDRYSRDALTEFLSTSQGYAPASGEIVGILKQLLEDMQGDLKEATDAENAAIAEVEGLVAAKEKEIQAATEAIEAKLERKGQLAVEIVNKKNDLDDAKESLAEDQKFLADLKKDCATKEKEFDERKASRAMELVAIAETIKILNDDDALDLFKKTLPSPALLQLTTSSRDVRDEAISALQIVKQTPQASYILLALMGKKVGFEKIIKLIDDLVVTLKKEQDDDDAQKEWCEKEFDVSDDKQKELKNKLADVNTQIDEMVDSIDTLKSELKALADGITALDKMVAEATATRKSEHAEFVELSAQNAAAVQLLEVAKNRMNKFYNPKLYKAPPKRELTEEERLYVASGGVLTTPAPGGIAGTGVTVFAEVRAADAPPPPPATAEAFKKKDAGGPLALIDSLKNDLEKDIQTNEMEEKEAQKDYEELTSDSAEKRAQDSKTITEKEGQKAGLEADLEAAKNDKADASKELVALGEYIAQLHGSCDFLIDNFSLRQDARANEIDALGKAKAVLNGADYSFVQVSSFLAKSAGR